MQSLIILKQVEILITPRVLQMGGLFDVEPTGKSEEKWTVDFTLPDQWNIGLIVGPSGSGKTTIARELFGNRIFSGFKWSKTKSIIDDFPSSMGIKDIADILSSVGFSSPPSWLRPFHVLSNGEQFRVNMARVIAECRKDDLIVIDEYTSVVDRTVAKIASAAIQKTIRKMGKKLIAITCHYDVSEWLEPDWIFQPATNQFVGGRYLRRPEIKLEIKRVHSSAWALFRKYHYLNTSINKAGVCFCAFWDGNPVAFTSVLHFPHARRKSTKREHRTVCLPDYQGVGIGNALSDYIGAMCKALGYAYISQTSHPAMMRARLRSKNWKMIAKPNASSQTMGKHFAENKLDREGKTGGFARRFRATFEYIGEALDRETALKLWND